MKIYNEIVIDMNPESLSFEKVIYEDSFDYHGDVMLALTKDEMRERWKAGNPDINGDGGVGVQDMILAGKFALEEGQTQEEALASTAEITFAVGANLGTFEQRQQESLLQQTQATDIQANPLPSLPSISNVGAVPFTGVVNWNAIPGGFQPLPQTAGGRKKLYQLSQFHGGINQKSSPRDISDQECQDAKNVTVSQVGRIKTLGDLKSSTSTGLTAIQLGDLELPNAGYGWFIFKSGYSFADPPAAGNTTINVTQDGKVTQLTDGTNTTSCNIANAETHVAPVYYAAGGGFYACDANFAHTTARQAIVSVYREDAFVITNDWETVNKDALLRSPIRSAASEENTVSLVDASGGDTDVNQNHQLIVNICDGGLVGANLGGTGSWDGTYYFYVSYLFDGGCETGLTAIGTVTFNEETLRLNPSLMHNSTNPFGDSVRYEGARIYFKESGTAERWLLAEISLQDGVKGALDSTFVPWTIVASVHDLTDAQRIVFDAPPALSSYLSQNGYLASEVYDLSNDDAFTDATCDYNAGGTADPTIAHDDDNGKIKQYMMVDGSLIPNGAYVGVVTSDTSFELYKDGAAVNTDAGSAVSNGTLSFYTTPTAHDVRYKTAVVGQQGVVFIGNVRFQGKETTDGMMFSMPGKPAIFPKFNFFDSPSSDGSPIMALAAFQDTILQFKENAMYVINVANPAQFHAEAAYRDCGVFNPCQVFTTAFGVIFANQYGCFIYDGNKVISLTNGKFDIDDWGLTETSSINADGTGVPCVGYDPRSQSIIVLKDIGHESTNKGSWVYNMLTQSWTEGFEFIDNVANDIHSNFQISPNGYLSIMQYDAGLTSTPATRTPYTYNIGESASNTQDITYITKDMDFGLPSQTKKIMKVYITYTSGGSNVPASAGVLFGVNGATPATEFSSGTFATSQTNTVLTLVPTSAATGIKSFAIKITDTVDEAFEINDISILYRVRPIK